MVSRFETFQEVLLKNQPTDIAQYFDHFLNNQLGMCQTNINAVWFTLIGLFCSIGSIEDTHSPILRGYTVYDPGYVILFKFIEIPDPTDILSAILNLSIYVVEVDGISLGLEPFSKPRLYQQLCTTFPSLSMKTFDEALSQTLWFQILRQKNVGKYGQEINRYTTFHKTHEFPLFRQNTLDGYKLIPLDGNTIIENYDFDIQYQSIKFRFLEKSHELLKRHIDKNIIRRMTNNDFIWFVNGIINSIQFLFGMTSQVTQLADGTAYALTMLRQNYALLFNHNSPVSIIGYPGIDAPIMLPSKIKTLSKMGLNFFVNFNTGQLEQQPVRMAKITSDGSGLERPLLRMMSDKCISLNIVQFFISSLQKALHFYDDFDSLLNFIFGQFSGSINSIYYLDYNEGSNSMSKTFIIKYGQVATIFIVQHPTMNHMDTVLPSEKALRNIDVQEVQNIISVSLCSTSRVNFAVEEMFTYFQTSRNSKNLILQVYLTSRTISISDLHKFGHQSDVTIEVKKIHSWIETDRLDFFSKDQPNDKLKKQLIELKLKIRNSLDVTAFVDGLLSRTYQIEHLIDDDPTVLTIFDEDNARTIWYKFGPFVDEPSTSNDIGLFKRRVEEHVRCILTAQSYIAKYDSVFEEHFKLMKCVRKKSWRDIFG